MPRASGQIDVAKNEAILDAAVDMLAERGVAGSLGEIARRAGVSKQTIYNHYGSKAELVQALCERRVGEITAPLDAPDAVDRPGETLAAYARVLMQALLTPRYAAIMRMAMLEVASLPEVARTLYEAGPRASRLRLADYLRREVAAGRLDCPDPLQAAEFFGGMVVGTSQTAFLLGVDLALDTDRIDAIAREAAARFLRAYAP